MTATPVRGADPLINYVRTGQPAATKQTGSKPDLAGSFTDAFSKASGRNGAQELQPAEDRRTENVKRSGPDASSANTGTDKAASVKKAEGKTDKTETAGKAQTPEDTGQAQDAVTEAGEKLVEKVAQELGISVEEVQQAMQELGLTAADLLNADSMTQLVLNLEGADPLTLMTDEGLYQSLKNLLGEVQQTAGQLQDSLGLTPEELNAIVEQVKAGEKEQTPKQKAPETLSPREQQPQQPEGHKDYTVTVEENGENVEIQVKKDDRGKLQSTEERTEPVPGQKAEEVIPRTQGQEASRKDASSQNSGQSASQQTNLLLEQLLNRENPVKADVAFDAAMTQRTADTQNIMNQIMDYMKVQVKADLTQMEIQLHPASLGTVNIHISSKEGVISAQFLTQNEAVKAAVESQIVQLKNSFEEQGLKVEAVEVAVENHSFERSLSGNQDGQEQTGEEKKKGPRRINLRELNPEEEDALDDAEQIAVAMMASDGNTVDYTA